MKETPPPPPLKRDYSQGDQTASLWNTEGSPCYEFIDTEPGSAPSSGEGKESGEENKTASLEDLPPPPPSPQTPRHSKVSELEVARNKFRYKDALSRQRGEWELSQELDENGWKIIRDESKKTFPTTRRPNSSFSGKYDSDPKRKERTSSYAPLVAYSHFMAKLDAAMPEVLKVRQGDEPSVMDHVGQDIIKQIKRDGNKKSAFIAGEAMVKIIWPALDKINEGVNASSSITFSLTHQENLMEAAQYAYDNKEKILTCHTQLKQSASPEKGLGL